LRGEKQKIGNREWKMKISFLISLFLILSLFASHFSLPHAADPKKKLNEIKKQLKTKKKKVKEAIKKEKSILSEIENIDKGINKKEKELRNYDKRISQTQSKILHLAKDIKSFAGKLDKRKRYLKSRLRTLYQEQYGGSALILISARDYQDLIKRIRYLSLIAYQDSRVMKKYRSELKELNFKKRNMEILHKKLEENKNLAQRKKKELRTNRAKKDKLLAAVRSKRSSYEKAIKELEESSRKLQELIKRLEKKKIPKSVTGKGFRAFRGHLPWPVNGKVVVPYGRYKDPKFKIPVFKNGIEIRAKKGDQPEAIAGGRIVYADWFKGYGLLLIINHGSGYHSLYGHLSEIFHETGDIIRQGTSVGSIGESRLLNVPTLYFEIRYKGKPIDPTRWLKSKQRRRR
jgi:septal ring factor EnvC (AmiA/AmiB activator)